MSLIRARRDRRELSGSGPKRPLSPAKLLVLLALVAFIIWWMDRFSG